MLQATEYDEIDYAEVEAMRESDDRRRAMIALHVAGRARFGKQWDWWHPCLIACASGERTTSARQCTTEELRGALDILINPRPEPEFTYPARDDRSGFLGDA